jgi:hypothetical protein
VAMAAASAGNAVGGVTQLLGPWSTLNPRRRARPKKQQSPRCARKAGLKSRVSGSWDGRTAQSRASLGPLRGERSRPPGCPRPRTQQHGNVILTPPARFSGCLSSTVGPLRLTLRPSSLLPRDVEVCFAREFRPSARQSWRSDSSARAERCCGPPGLSPTSSPLLPLSARIPGAARRAGVLRDGTGCLRRLRGACDRQRPQKMPTPRRQRWDRVERRRGRDGRELRSQLGALRRALQ